VASNVGGLGEVIQDGHTGLLVPPGDVEALAQALLGLLRQPALADRLGTQGRQFALEHLSMKAYGDKVMRLYQRVLSCPEPSDAAMAKTEVRDGER
jgi:glycosyltransferase involved in cell wall biosynthesis